MIAAKLFCFTLVVILAFAGLNGVQARLKARYQEGEPATAREEDADSEERDLVTTKRITWVISVNGKTVTYKKGTKVLFNHDGTHNVYRFLSKQAYQRCDFSSSGAKKICGTSPTSCPFTLSTTGTRYFGCQVPGHCGAGMKMIIKAVA
jgi:plastocyanin